MTTYPGLPGREVGDHLTREASRAHYAPGTDHIGRIWMVANTGTYLDAPFHRFADGADLDGVVVRVAGAGGRAVDRNALAAHDVAGRAVLVQRAGTVTGAPTGTAIRTTRS